MSACSSIESGQNYQTKEEAGKAALTFLEDKYQRKFTLVSDGKLKESKKIKYFTTKFKDEKGLEAEIQLPQEKKTVLRMCLIQASAARQIRIRKPIIPN